VLFENTPVRNNYRTVSVRSTVRARPLLVAVAAIVYVPAGVTGAGGGFGFEPFSRGMARPTPHPVAVTRTDRKTTAIRLDRRCRHAGNKLIGSKIASQTILVLLVSGLLLEDVVVTPVRTVTETVVAVPSDTLEGVIVQVEFAGMPVQVKLAVPETFAAELRSSG
jgi:hypothetical protein